VRDSARRGQATVSPGNCAVAGMVGQVPERPVNGTIDLGPGAKAQQRMEGEGWFLKGAML